MDIFTRLLQENQEIIRLQEALRKEGGIYDLTGMSDPVKPHVIHGLQGKAGRKKGASKAGGSERGTAPEKAGGTGSARTGGGIPLKLVIAADEEKARTLYEGLKFLEPAAVFYPAKDLLFYQSDIHGSAQTAERLKALKAVYEGRTTCLVASVEALINKMAPVENLFSSVIRVKVGDLLKQDSITGNLLRLGYEPATICEHKGEFSIRGGIIDVYPIIAEHPYRIELWDEEVDSIRLFDEGSQKSVEKVEEAEIFPAMELALTEAQVIEGVQAMEKDANLIYDAYRAAMRTEEAYHIKSSFEEKKEALQNGLSCQDAEGLLPYFCSRLDGLLDYIPKDALIFYDDAGRIWERAISYGEEFAESSKRRLEAGLILPRQQEMLISEKELFGSLSAHPGVILSVLQTGQSPLPV